MKTLFLADAHLRHPADDNYRALLAFLEEQITDTERLVLLGDIFEFCVGYRHTVFANHVPLLHMLGRYREQGIEILYVEGNHDFHLGPYFEDRLEVKVLPDGGGIKLDDRDVYIAHGDLANPADRGYRLLRSVLRSRLLRWLLAIMPPDLTWRLAALASRQSKRSTPEKSRQWPARDILLTYARSLGEQGYQVVVTGHFHQPFHVREDGLELLALGDWINQFSYAVAENGGFELKTYTLSAEAC